MHHTSPKNFIPATANAALIAFVVGAALPFVFGVYVLVDFHQYVDSLPPGSGVCGMPALLGYSMIFIVSPAIGLICALAAAIGVKIFHWLR